MNDLDPTTQAVLRSLREKPALNTPSLIAMSDDLPEGTDKDDIERALGELVEAGIAIHRTTGWKLAPAES